MMVTSSFRKAYAEHYRYHIYILLEDYIQAQTTFMKDLYLELERFDRALKLNGILFCPYEGDIEATRAQVLSKPWQASEKRCLCKTPGILILNVSFDLFDPQLNPWIYLNFNFEIKINKP